MDDDVEAYADQAEHSSFSPDTRCYHFASQSLFLSNNGPSHFGLAGGDNRVYLVYESQSKLEIYKYMKKKEHLRSSEEKIDDDAIFSCLDKEQFILERTVLLHHDAIDIGQVVYSSLMPEFFVILAKGGLAAVKGSEQQRYCMRSLKVYTNYMTTSSTMDSVKLRGSGELLATLNSNTDSSSDTFVPLSEHLTQLNGALNLIDLKHADISTLAHHVAVCPAADNLLISTANGSMLLYSRHRLRAPQPADEHFVTLDFVLSKSITILDSWTPEVVKLSLNYVAFMCPTHFSLIQIVLDKKKELKKDQRKRVVAKNGLDRFSTHNNSNGHLLLEPNAHLIYNRLFDEPAPAEVALFGPFTPLHSSRLGADVGGSHTTSNGPNHADTVWGPVGSGLGCRFAVYDYCTDDLSGKTITSSSTYKLLFCRHFSLPPRQPIAKKLRTKGTKESGSISQPKAVPNELRRIAVKNSLISEEHADNYFLYGFELLPYRDQNGTIFAHALYILSASQQLDCYLVNLRRDHLRLVPISQLSFGPQTPSRPPPPPPSTSTLSTSSKLVKTFPSMSSLASTITSVSTMKNNHTISATSTTSTAKVLDFTANPQEDLVHVLLDSGYLDSYATQIFPFLVSDQLIENLYCSRPIASMYRISGNLFLNVIAALSSPRFVYLLSGAAENLSSTPNYTDDKEEQSRQLPQRQHTVYYLERPSIDHLQADILSALDDLKSSSDELAMIGVAGRVHDRHSFHRLYCRVLAIIKFALRYPMRSITRTEKDVEKINNEEVKESKEIKPEDNAAMQCLKALYEKVKEEIGEIIKEGANCTDPTCLFAVSQFAQPISK